MRLTDTRADEQERGITIKSTGISLYYTMTEEAMKGFKGDKDGNGYLVRQCAALLPCATRSVSLHRSLAR